MSISATLTLCCCAFCAISPGLQQSLLLCICWIRQSDERKSLMHWMHVRICSASGCRSVTVHQCKCEFTVLLRSLTMKPYVCLQVWYFGPNIGHAILGLEPSGCTYLAGESAACPAAIVNHIMSRDALLGVPIIPSMSNPLADRQLLLLWVQIALQVQNCTS